MSDGERNVTIILEADAALVLFELLCRWADDDQDNVNPQHPAEELALARLLGSLESQLPEPFSRQYDTLVADALKRLTPGD
ncbi:MULTISPECIES: hypothetical protein [unclassified Nocardioides]|uniref:hypothetical protein n=1 Tax=unclassified Nocardioides TaxID=2615069 RepID=UPI003014B83F